VRSDGEFNSCADGRPASYAMRSDAMLCHWSCCSGALAFERRLAVCGPGARASASASASATAPELLEAKRELHGPVLAELGPLAGSLAHWLARWAASSTMSGADNHMAALPLRPQRAGQPIRGA